MDRLEDELRSPRANLRESCPDVRETKSSFFAAMSRCAHRGANVTLGLGQLVRRSSTVDGVGKARIGPEHRQERHRLFRCGPERAACGKAHPRNRQTYKARFGFVLTHRGPLGGVNGLDQGERATGKLQPICLYFPRRTYARGFGRRP
jgi:hypothetical protein